MSRTIRAVVTIVLVGAVYCALGVLTGALAHAADSTSGRDLWRWAAWLASLVVFLWHLHHEHRRAGSTVQRAALRTAAAVAFGAFALALAGPVRSHWGSDHAGRIIVLSLLVWPFLAGIPAFLVAMVLAATSERLMKRTDKNRQVHHR